MCGQPSSRKRENNQRWLTWRNPSQSSICIIDFGGLQTLLTVVAPSFLSLGSPLKRHWHWGKVAEKREAIRDVEEGGGNPMCPLGYWTKGWNGFMVPWLLLSLYIPRPIRFCRVESKIRRTLRPSAVEMLISGGLMFLSRGHWGCCCLWEDAFRPYLPNCSCSMPFTVGVILVHENGTREAGIHIPCIY